MCWVNEYFNLHLIIFSLHDDHFSFVSMPCPTAARTWWSSENEQSVNISHLSEWRFDLVMINQFIFYIFIFLSFSYDDKIKSKVIIRLRQSLINENVLFIIDSLCNFWQTEWHLTFGVVCCVMVTWDLNTHHSYRSGSIVNLFIPLFFFHPFHCCHCVQSAWLDF